MQRYARKYYYMDITYSGQSFLIPPLSRIYAASAGGFTDMQLHVELYW